MEKSKSSNHLLGQNPIIRKLSKINEFDADNSCTYGGVARKLIFFVVMVIAGIAGCMFVKMSGMIPVGDVIFDKQVFEDAENVVIGMNEAIIVGIAAIVFIISPFLAVFIRPTIPVTGSLYCISTGYILSWAAMTFADVYLGPVLLALVITLMIVVTMGFLYGSGIIKVTQKLKTIVFTLLVTVLVGSLLTFIGSLIPATQGIVAQITGNPVISIGGSILLVIIGTLFLLVDFDTIRESVENRLPKKYEWYCAFGLAFSVIWLYFKVLDLILKIMGSNRK